MRAHPDRYVAASLPHLPFADGHFDLALSAHLLFTYADRLDFAFHYDSILELARTAAEVRLFPLVTADGVPYPHLNTLIDQLTEAGLKAIIRDVEYEFQRGGNQTLTITRN